MNRGIHSLIAGRRLTIGLPIALMLTACGESAPQSQASAPPPAAQAEAPPAPQAPAPQAQEAQTPARAAWVDAARIRNADSEPGQWMAINRTYDEQRFSPLDRINRDNVSELGLAWHVDLGTFRGNEATPLMIDGVIYNTAPFNITQAIDAVTGQVLWTYDPEVPRETARKACCDVVTRGLAAWEGKIVIAALDGRLIAIDAETGGEVWSVQTLELDKFENYTITGAPRVFDGKVLIGNSGAERGVRGYVSAYDADNGDLLWRFYTVPGNPADGFENAAMEMAAETWAGEWWLAGGGGTAWDSIVYEPDLNLIYIGVGNGSPWIRRFRSDDWGDNLFLASIVAVDADTGEYRWHYQTTPGEEWDYTATQPMMLADLEIEGEPRRVLMQAPKNGYFYVLDAATGELLSAENFAPITWATGIDMETGRPIEAPEARFGEEPVLISPGPGGAHNYNPWSYSPDTGLIYFPVVESYFSYSAAQSFDPATPGTGMGFAGYEELRAQHAEYSAENTRAWLTAWDPVEQREAWRVMHSANGSGGATVTAGGLVFHGTIDKTFAAYDAATGEKLWESDVQTVPLAGPIVYEADGEQYVAINVGWGGGLAHVSAGAQWMNVAQARLLAFRLGGTAELPPMPDREPPAPPPVVRASAETIAHGQALFAEHCALCHGQRAVGGLVDLRLMTDEGHAQFEAIVLDGIRAEQGMLSFSDLLDEADSEAIHQYVISRANEDWGELAAVGR